MDEKLLKHNWQPIANWQNDVWQHVSFFSPRMLELLIYPLFKQINEQWC